MQEWQRLVWWSGQNSAAIQALSAIAIVVLTAVLGGITLYYALITGRMARTMERQIEFSFQPNVLTAITFQAEGGGTAFGLRHEDTVYADIKVENKSNVPIKLVSVGMLVKFDNGVFPDSWSIKEAGDIVLAPGAHKEFSMMVDVPPRATRANYTRRVNLKCTDLSGVSRHTFSISDANADVSHSLGFADN
jgi:hypothetical protein